LGLVAGVATDTSAELVRRPGFALADAFGGQTLAKRRSRNPQSISRVAQIDDILQRRP